MLLVTKEIFFGETKVVGMVGERGWTNSLLDVASKPSTLLGDILPYFKSRPGKNKYFWLLPTNFISTTKNSLIFQTIT